MSFGEQHDKLYSHDKADAPVSRPSTEPLSEAKQAAVQGAMAELGRIGNRRPIKEILESLYDTATAKSREDVFNAVFPKGTENDNESWEQILKAIRDTNEELMEAMKQLHEADVEIAKLREELEELRTASFHDVSENIARMVTEYVESGIKLGTDWRNGLANIIALRLKRVQMDKDKHLAHQPLDSARGKQPSAITTNEQAYRDGTLSQPSAPTAGVEKKECQR